LASRAVRFGIPLAAIAAAAIGVALPVPGSLPDVALGNRELLWLERTPLFFYGFLLLFVPLLRALEGELPIELSARGARYAESSNAALEELKTRVDDNEEILNDTFRSVEAIRTRLDSQ
jgi:hypothetical protein